MTKIIFAVSLIFIFGGAWLALDYLNKQEQNRALEMHHGIEQARLEAKRRTDVRTNFETFIRANQENCTAAAEKSQSDYMALLSKTMPAKRKGPSTIPLPITTEAAVILENAKMECQRISTELMNKGI